MTSQLDSMFPVTRRAPVGKNGLLVAGAPACSNCGRRLEIDDPERIVCIAHLEFRSPASGGDCAHYAPAKAFPDPPQLDGGPAPAASTPRR